MTTKNNKKEKKDFSQWIKIMVVVSVLLAVLLVMSLKNDKSETIIEATGVSTQEVENALSVPENDAQDASGTPEEQLDRYLESGKPVFVFFHSTNCQSCIDMMAIVDQVYPEFESSVPLIDVNVYDPINENLLRRARINTIPTQLFVDAAGQGKIAMGIMTPEQLSEQLALLAGQ